LTNPPTADHAGVSQALDALFAPWNRSDAPGLVVGIARGREVVYRRGFGMASLEQACANSPATRMRIGSTTKHFTCLAALLLAGEGKLDIDASIRTYLPELPALEGEPTLRQLMSHTGGYRCYLDVSMLTNGAAILPVGASLDYMARQTAANFAPGAQMIYCNGGYVLISIAIERASGIPIRQFLEQRIFWPMGMADTELAPSDMEILPGAATLHLVSPQGLRRGIFPSEEVIGEGGMISTIDDMLTWLAHLRAPTVVGDAAIWAQMMTPARYTGGGSGAYCLGLMRNAYRGVETVHHAGGVFGGASQMLTVPAHQLDIIMMTNRSDVSPADLTERVLDIILEGELSPAPEHLDEAAGKALVGRYFSPRSRVLYSIRKNEAGFGLGINNSQGRPLPIERTATGELRADPGSMAAITIEGADLASPTPPDSLDFTVAGETHAYRRLAEAPPPISEFTDLIGDYANPDTDSRATITDEDDALFMNLVGRFGRTRYALKPIDQDILLFRRQGMSGNTAMTGSLLVMRQGDAVTTVEMNTPRTRGLRFTRVGSGGLGRKPLASDRQSP